VIAINKVLLLGTVTDEGPRLTYAEHGTPQCSFMLLVAEPGKEGATFKLYVPVDIFGDRAESVAETIQNGDVVLVDGKLRWRSWIDKKTGQKEGKLAVLAWSVQVERSATRAPVSAN
jgi:single-strand DNA-binding protein